jgi:hypothetical protein
MSKHVTVSPSEAADRLAIRELIEVAERGEHQASLSTVLRDVMRQLR